MKKVMMALMACLLIVSTSSAKTIHLDDLYEKMYDLPGGETHHVSAALIAFAKLFVSGEDAEELRPFKSVSVVTLDECREDIKKPWIDKIMNGHFTDYSLLVSENKEDKLCQIWVRKKNEKIVRMIIFAKENKSCHLMRIKGKFTLEEIIDDPDFYKHVIH